MVADAGSRQMPPVISVHFSATPSRAEGSKHEFNLELKEEGKLIGGVGFSDVDEYQGTGEIGYWVAEPHWRKGIMTEAVTKALEYAFDVLGLRRVTLKAYTPNEGSNAIAKKFGFTLEGTMKQANRTKSTGDIYDVNIYGLMREDWKK